MNCMNKLEYRIGVIGRYGASSNDCDGQTVKTRNLVHLLETQENIFAKKVMMDIFL